MDLKNIAILGPRGTVGTAIINELIKDGSAFNITTISRPTSSYAAPASSNITSKSVDFASLSSLIEAFIGQDAIVNCVSGSAVQYEASKLIINAAVAAGVKFFFANEFVGHVKSEFYKGLPESAVGAKLRIREYLEEMGKEGKIKWTSLNGGPFFDMWLMKGPAGFDIHNRQARIYGTGNNKLCWTPLSTIAQAMREMLRNADTFINRPIYICPFLHTTLNQNTILAAIESVVGTKFNITHVDVEKINENARIALDRGEVAKAMKGLAISGQFYEGARANDFSHLVENEVVGVQPMSIEDAVRNAMQKWGEDCPVVEGMFKVDPCEV